MKVLVAQSCPTLCDPTDCSPPGSTIRRILQAKILKWIAIPFFRDLLDLGIKPRSPVLKARSLPSEPQGKTIHLSPTMIHFMVSASINFPLSPSPPPPHTTHRNMQGFGCLRQFRFNITHSFNDHVFSICVGLWKSLWKMNEWLRSR